MKNYKRCDANKCNYFKSTVYSLTEHSCFARGACKRSIKKLLYSATFCSFWKLLRSSFHVFIQRCIFRWVTRSSGYLWALLLDANFVVANLVRASGEGQLVATFTAAAFSQFTLEKQKTQPIFTTKKNFQIFVDM